ncbi:MAG: c-type cytochrome [Deltaproteobacteria bacterium]|nr:c-type cytochrome [Deltaproteobacteria bacterium]
MNTQARTKWWTQRGSLVGLMAMTLFWMIPGTGLAQEEVILTNGKTEYQGYCALCHGDEAKGDGPMSNILTIKPADLTRLSKKNGGEFPFWRIYRTIDGRDEVRGHGARNMPVWGAYFLTEEGGSLLDEDRVIGRILSLVYYLRSIQEK